MLPVARDDLSRNGFWLEGLRTWIPGYRPKTEKRAYLRIFNNIPSWLKNKYLLTAAGFAVWILFIDDRDFITTHFRHVEELKKLEASKKYYQEQIAATRKELDQLKSNPETIEKYAREKYLMKRDNEDVFLIREK